MGAKSGLSCRAMRYSDFTARAGLACRCWHTQRSEVKVGALTDWSGIQQRRSVLGQSSQAEE